MRAWPSDCALAFARSLIVAATKQAERWPRIAAPEQRAFIRRVVASATASEKEIQIVLHRNVCVLKTPLALETVAFRTGTG